MYTVVVGPENVEVENRRAAVQVARERSAAWRGTVQVHGPHEVMTWRNGSLVEGRYTTSDRRR